MTTQQLPERPNLEQLKHQAKTLLRSAQEKNTAALARFRALPAFAQKSDSELALQSLALHDAQSVIAREHGFDSWNALRERVEELTLEFVAAVDQFIAAATEGRTDRAARLLALHPRIARANFHTALVHGDAAAIETYLASDPSLATKPGGPRGWEPLHYVCHSTAHRGAPARAEGLVAIARRLLALGADPNLRFPWLHHGVRRPVLWGAACVARHLPLAQLLLESGANPNDGVTLPLAAGLSDLPTLELLVAHGANVNGTWATDGAPVLHSILQWAGKPDGARWLIEHGADANAVFAASGETPLHAVARKWDVALAEQLRARGADLARPRADGRSPYALAELNGNRAVAEWLLAHGAPAAMSEVDCFVAACRRGDRGTADRLLAARPELPRELGAEHTIALQQAAERDDIRALETMLACGFNPNAGDCEMGATALHRAAMEGWPEAVRVLLAQGADVAARDKEFHGTPLVWAAEGSRSGRRTDRDHNGVARLLLAAGSPADWTSPEPEPAEGIGEILDAWRRAYRPGP